MGEGPTHQADAEYCQTSRQQIHTRGRTPRHGKGWQGPHASLPVLSGILSIHRLECECVAVRMRRQSVVWSGITTTARISRWWRERPPGWLRCGHCPSPGQGRGGRRARQRCGQQCRRWPALTQTADQAASRGRQSRPPRPPHCACPRHHSWRCWTTPRWGRRGSVKWPSSIWYVLY